MHFNAKPLWALADSGYNFEEAIYKAIYFQNTRMIYYLYSRAPKESLGDINENFTLSLNTEFYEGAVFFSTKLTKPPLNLVTKEALLELAAHALKTNYLELFQRLLDQGLNVHQNVVSNQVSLLELAMVRRSYRFLFSMTHNGAYLYAHPGHIQSHSLLLFTLSSPVKQMHRDILEESIQRKNILFNALEKVKNLDETKKIINKDEYSISFLLNFMYSFSTMNCKFIEPIFDYIAHIRPKDFKKIIKTHMVKFYSEYKNKRLARHYYLKRNINLPEFVWTEILSYSDGAYLSHTLHDQASKLISKREVEEKTKMLCK